MRVGDTFTYTIDGRRYTEVVRLVYAVEHERMGDGSVRDLDVYGVDDGVSLRTRTRRDGQTTPGSVAWRRFPSPAAACAWLHAASTEEVAGMPRLHALRALEGAPSSPATLGRLFRSIRHDPELWASRVALRRVCRCPGGGQGRWMEEYDRALTALVGRFCRDRCLAADPLSERLVVRWRDVGRADARLL